MPLRLKKQAHPFAPTREKKPVSRKWLWVWIIVFIILGLGAGVFNFPNAYNGLVGFVNAKTPFHLDTWHPRAFRLGLDLLGGTELIYEADLSGINYGERDEALQGVRDVIERRANALGVAEPVVQVVRTGTADRILVQLAGIQDVRIAIQMIGETPILEFKEQAPPQEVQIQGDEIQAEGEGEIDIQNIQIGEIWKNTALSGKHLKSARVEFDPNTGQPNIAIDFNKDGEDLFGDLTAANVGKPIAIFLDGGVISAPTVQQEIRGGGAIITGSFSIEEAKLLARRLNAGALPVPIALISQQTVGATLGQISLEQSLKAALIGFLLVALFMILYYRISGLLAILALLIYASIVLALFKLIPVTLTLAGIAGFILSVGIAVDANVLIFERLKEELRGGRSFSSAVVESFKRAWTSIRDANITTMIAALVLFWFSTSVIKGFALTLGLGVLLSMFSALLVTRTLLLLVAGWKWSKRPGLFAPFIKR